MKRWPLRNNLRTAVFVSVVLPMVALMLAAGIASFVVTNYLSSSQLDQRVHNLAQSSSVPIQELLWRFNEEEIQVLLDNFVTSGILIGAKVADGNGFSVEAGIIDKTDDVISVTEPLSRELDGQMFPLGTLTFVASKEGVYALGRRRGIALIVISSVTIFLTTAAIFSLLRRRIIRPVLEIQSGLNSATDASEDFTFGFSRNSERSMIDELRKVVDAIYRMRQSIFHAQEMVQDQQKKVVRAAELAGLGYGTFNLSQTRFVETDDNLARMFGRSVDQLLEIDFSNEQESNFILNQDPEKRAARRAALATGNSLAETIQVAWKNGDVRDIRFVIEPIIPDGDGPVLLELAAQDITELRRTEERARQAEKLQTIGKLTGGVAHDINNILAIISGNLELIEDATDDDRIRSVTENALTAVDRGARVTQQLLAFARRQPLSPVRLDPSRLIKNIKPMLALSAGPSIDLEIVTDSGLWMTVVDPTQLEASILNLVVNARDAMPEGGKLTIEVSNARIDRDYARSHTEVQPGQYVCISVTDTGVGMSPNAIANAFEPFFTTKEVGKGTGLGLSMVFGFSKQSGGHAKIYSEEGHGTIVKLYLPRAHGAASPTEKTAPTNLEATSVVGGKRILLIEDEPDLLQLYTMQLKSLGCEVDTASSGADALALVGKIAAPDMILTDVILPGNMNGKRTVDALLVHYPDTPVIFMSGFTENAIIHDGKLDVGSVMLQKPFTLANLAATVAEVFRDHVGKPNG